MKQSYADVLDDYFDALLDESPEQASELALAPQPMAEPAAKPVAPFAEPDAAARRQALEALLAQVAALKEEEATATTADTPTQVQPEGVLAPEPEPTPIVVPAPAATVVAPAIVAPAAIVAPIVVPEVATIVAPQVAPIAMPLANVNLGIDVELQAQLAAQQQLADQAAAWRNMDTEQSFQVLFFEVAGMTFAVPLTHLGGIYQVAKLTSLFGKPHWFAGVQTERDRQIYAVDTARWAMPGHTAKEEYGYLVTLGESNWGLGCHQLKGTALLTRDQVKWRSTPGARPWLAGMVKERMCALLHVDALIALLEQGKNIDGQQV